MKRPLLYVIAATVFFSVSIGIGLAQFDFLIDFLNLREEDPVFFQSFSIIKLEEAWNVINSTDLTTTSVKIGIIDSGLDASNGAHPEFDGISLGNTPVDARTDSASGGHGTQISGIIGANNISSTSSGNYDLPQMNGILSGVKDLDYTLEVRKPRFFGAFFSVDAWSVSKEINKLAKENVDIINISNGTLFLGGDFFFRPAFTRLSNTLFVVSAGNFNFDFLGIGPGTNVENQTPARLGDEFNNVITAGSVDSGGNNRAIFSNFGDAIALAAPGELVYTSAPRGEGNAPIVDPDAINYQFDFSGTSASAPMVTGVAGIIKAIKPNLAPAQIKQILIQTADIISTDQPIGPRLNAFKAVCHPLVLNCEEVLPGAPHWPMIKHDAQNSGLSPVVNIILVYNKINAADRENRTPTLSDICTCGWGIVFSSLYNPKSAHIRAGQIWRGS